MTGPGPLGPVGSGEYLPVLEHVERALFDGRPPRCVQLATAAAPEGPESLGRWHALGRAVAERLGVHQVVVPVVDRVSADDEELAALVDGAAGGSRGGSRPGCSPPTVGAGAPQGLQRHGLRSAPARSVAPAVPASRGRPLCARSTSPP